MRRRYAASAILLATILPGIVRGQHEGHDMSQHGAMTSGPLGLSMDRMGSGTTWIPDAVSVPSAHIVSDRWMLMLHGFVFAQYDKQNGPRGDDQIGSLNWAMLMASRMVGSNHVQLRTMLSLDPWTVTARGYPMLLQVGETYRGTPLRDRQHPHDFWMEVAALVEREITRDVGIQLYIAPSGEPALGPVAFMHRPSAMDDPFAPLGHHWQDATHISYGVLTTGVFTRRWKLEGSYFNGREPDEDRFYIDPIRLNSFSGRISFNPSQRWSLTAGYGEIKGHERLHPESIIRRAVASVLYGRRLGADGQASGALVWGSNDHGGGWTHAALAEGEAILDRRNTFFGRLEVAQRNDVELGIVAGDPHDSHSNPAGHASYNTGALSVGYIRELFRAFGTTTGIGGRWTVNMIPSALQAYYGSAPTAFAFFVRTRPFHRAR